MRCAIIIASTGLIFSGCSKPEQTAAPVAAAPARVSVESAGETAPPPPTPAEGTPAPAADGAPAPEEKREPNSPPKSVYDNISPEQKALALKFNRNRDWLVIFKSGTDAQKQQAKKAIAALPPAERAEFENMTKMYGIPYP